MQTRCALFTATILVLAGCGHDARSSSSPMAPTLVGSGHMQTQSRPMSGVQSVSVTAGAELTIELGGAGELTITTDDNMMDHVMADMMNGHLTLGMRGDMPMHMTRPVQFHLTMPDMPDMHDVDCSAGAHVQMRGLDTTHLSIRLSSGATFTATGRADRCQMDLSAGSRCDSPMLRTRTMTASLSAGSYAAVRVSEALTATASAASTLEYWGDPAVSARTSAASTIRRAGP
jgi:putative autotransporter adhesin-like protein